MQLAGNRVSLNLGFSDSDTIASDGVAAHVRGSLRHLENFVVHHGRI
jgi:hypothetical protein